LKRFFILAGEPSGDIHGARLMEELRKQDDDVEFIGIGGDNMQKQGLDSLISLEQMSVVGISEVAKKILFFREVMYLCRNTLKSGNFDALIPIDYPGFNLKLSAYAKDMNIPVLYYIAPQLWAWGKNRTKKMKENVDLLMAVFPFELDFFGNLGINTVFVGHPLLDIPDYNNSFLPREERDLAIAIFPGSRKQEIQKHLGLVKQIVKRFNTRLPEYEIRIALSKADDRKYYRKIARDFPKLVLSDKPKELMRTSMAGIVKTGTSNLEAALSGLPINMFYKTTFLSYWFGKLTVNIEHLSLINILSDKKIINEYIQYNAKAEPIVNDILDIIQDEKRYARIQDTYRDIRKMLGENGASENAAKQILNFLQ